MRFQFELLAVLTVAEFLGGCGPILVLRGSGPASDKISHLSGFVLILFCIVAAVMWALIALVVSRPRGSFDDHATIDAGGGHSWLLVGGFAIPATILFVIFIMGLDTMAAFPIHDGHATPAGILVTGHQWWWEIEYLSENVGERVTTANEMHVPVGKPVDIDLASGDVIHSFWVPALHGKVDLIPGQLNRIRIEADQPGVYRGQCAEYCGTQHAHMILLVVADPPDVYAKWLEHQRSDAAPPTDSVAIEGQTVLASKPCGLCHTIRGTGAQGKVGPDLTHIGSRRALAANMLRNDDGDLSAWITHAQSIKPGSMMPDLTQFTGEEVQEVVAYLRQLQ